MSRAIRVVGAVLLIDAHVFAARRNPAKSQGGLWEFPGGKIEDGESPEEALARELREELRIDARVHAPVTSTVHHYDTVTIELSTFYCTLVAGSGEPVLTEHTEARWVPVAELDQLDWAPADIPAVEAIMREHATTRTTGTDREHD
ncbi:(deoxy)nucleoside triphosphate pyrophosphohydrolase [Corynebacterium hadale]|uniref:(deoxy)nucleoside triphosphate pyrophosphohydrolase n=2 Tax=Corynebacterium hadale TaxID=2026255 RepID=UPI0030B8897E